MRSGRRLVATPDDLSRDRMDTTPPTLSGRGCGRIIRRCPRHVHLAGSSEPPLRGRDTLSRSDGGKVATPTITVLRSITVPGTHTVNLAIILALFQQRQRMAAKRKQDSRP